MSSWKCVLQSMNTAHVMYWVFICFYLLPVLYPCYLYSFCNRYSLFPLLLLFYLQLHSTRYLYSFYYHFYLWLVRYMSHVLFTCIPRVTRDLLPSTFCLSSTCHLYCTCYLYPTCFLYPTRYLYPTCYLYPSMCLVSSSSPDLLYHIMLSSFLQCLALFLWFLVWRGRCIYLVLIWGIYR